jgi:hypothetical protein
LCALGYSLHTIHIFLVEFDRLLVGFIRLLAVRYC